MALFRKLFYQKPPDGLLEISERVYVFDCCFTTEVLEEGERKVYMGRIVAQLRQHFPDSSFMVFNFREGECQSQTAKILSEYGMTVIDYSQQYKGCPLLSMEMIHHFLRSSESWLHLGLQNILLMHCERGGWPVLAFMVAALLIYRKQYTGEQRTLDMIYKQAPRELLQQLSPLNPLPSQIRYLQYISRRNVSSEWPPLDRALTMDCVILRIIPNFDGKGGCRPIFRIYGQDPLLASDRSPKVLFSTPKKSKLVQLYRQADCELVKIDVHCHIQGDVVLECINLDEDLEREEMMFRVMFNTSFIRSNILMLNCHEIDLLWDAKDRFPKDFRAEVLLSELDAANSSTTVALACVEEKGLPVEAFARVQEMFSNVDWLNTKGDAAFHVLQQLTSSNAFQEKPEPPQKVDIDTGLQKSGPKMLQEKIKSIENSDEINFSSPLTLRQLSVTTSKNFPDSNTMSQNTRLHDLQAAQQCPSQHEIMPRCIPVSRSTPASSCNSLSGSPKCVSRYYSAPSALGITALLHDHAMCEVAHSTTASATVQSISTIASSGPSRSNISSRWSSPPPPPPQSPSSKNATFENSVIPPPPPPPVSDVIRRNAAVCDVSTTISTFRQPSPPPSPLTPLEFMPPTHKLSASIPDASEPLPHPQNETSSPVKGRTASFPSPLPLPSHSRTSSPSASPGTDTATCVSSKHQLPSLNISNMPLSASPPPPPPLLISSSSISPSQSSKKATSTTSIPLPPPSPSHSGSASSAVTSSAPPPSPPPLLSSKHSSAVTSSGPPPNPLPSLSSKHSSAVTSSASPPPPLPHISPKHSSTVTSSTPPPPLLPHLSPKHSSGVTSSAPPPPPPPYLSSKHSSAATLSAPPPPPPPPHLSSKHSGDPTFKSSAVPPVPPVPPPLSPCAPKGSGAASTHSNSSGGKGTREVVPPPPPSGLSAFSLGGKGRGLPHTSPRSMLSTQSSTRRTNLKPLHWVKVTRAMQGSLWAEAQKSDEVSKSPVFDMSELESLFSAATPNSDVRGSAGKSSGHSTGPKSEKVHLIDLRRANNCEIMLTKVKMPLNDLMSSVLALDDSVLDGDQVDNLIKFCPTKEEMELLKGYNGDKENLGKCEQYFLELMKVPRMESKFRVFSFKIQFRTQVADLSRNLNIINSAAEEVRSSVKLKRIMQTILSLGNALNQGTARGSAIGFRLDTLLKLTDTRARNNKMTLMHYLCKILADKLPEFDFPKDLVSLEAASKIQLKYLAEEMQAISKGLEKVEQELTASENDGPVSETFRKTLKEFLAVAEAEVRNLTSLYSNVGRSADALALYFGEDPAQCPFEQVVSTLLYFVRMFTRAHEENCKQLELEKKKAQKEAENEKIKLNGPKKEPDNISQPPMRSASTKK